MADIFDGAMGLVPIRTPLESETIKVVVKSGVSLYPGQVVDLDTGELDKFDETAAGPCLGVCLDYAVGVADNSIEATVCNDPGMRYKVKGNDAFAQLNVGQHTDMLNNAGSSTTLLATGVADTAAANGTITLQRILTITGKYDVVAIGDPKWFEVRLNNLELDVKFDALT